MKLDVLGIVVMLGGLALVVAVAFYDPAWYTRCAAVVCGLVLVEIGRRVLLRNLRPRDRHAAGGLS